LPAKAVPPKLACGMKSGTPLDQLKKSANCFRGRAEQAFVGEAQLGRIDERRVRGRQRVEVARVGSHELVDQRGAEHFREVHASTLDGVWASMGVGYGSAWLGAHQVSIGDDRTLSGRCRSRSTWCWSFDRVIDLLALLPAILGKVLLN